MYTIDDYDWRFPFKEVHYSLMAYMHTPNELWEQNLSQTYDISGVFFTISYGAAENNTALVLETHFTVAKTFFCHSSTIHMCNLHVSRIQSMQLVHVKCTETLQFKIHSEKRKKIASAQFLYVTESNKFCCRMEYTIRLRFMMYLYVLVPRSIHRWQLSCKKGNVKNCSNEFWWIRCGISQWHIVVTKFESWF